MDEVLSRVDWVPVSGLQSPLMRALDLLNGGDECMCFLSRLQAIDGQEGTIDE